MAMPCNWPTPNSSIDIPSSPPFNVDNRGKRSVGLDLKAPGGRELLLRLVKGCDVFMTSFRPGALERMRDLETTMNRRLIQRIAQVKTSGLTSVPMYRDRGELEQQEPFCLDRPSALHEWEVSRLRESLLHNFEDQAKIFRIFCIDDPQLRGLVKEQVKRYLH